MDHAVAARQEFTLRIHHRFKAPREESLPPGRTPETLKRWRCPPRWLASSIELNLEEGGRYAFSMQRSWAARRSSPLTVTFLTVSGSRFSSSTRGSGTVPFMICPFTYVTVNFREVDGGTEIDLRQDDLSLRVCAKHLTGMDGRIWETGGGSLISGHATVVAATSGRGRR